MPRRRDGLLDRPEGRADRGVHDPSNGQSSSADAAPGLAYAGLFGDDGVVRV